jgi:phosphatidylglycerol---prolipoprotein diacylglyceryl transferase
MVISVPVAVIDIGLDPVLLKIGPFSVHWYGLMYVLGIAAGLFVMLRYAESRGIGRELAYEFFWPILVACLVGGRLYYVVQSNFGWYLQHPQNILATWEGGMAFYGAVFAGSITGLILSRLKHLRFGYVLDVAVLFITPAQTVGRIGNIVNGDILGYASNLPWATRYTNPNNTFVPSHTIAYQPAAVYELLFSLALFVIAWKLRHRFRVPGTLFTLWLVAYSAGQFLLFFGRANAVVLLGLKQAQLTAIVVTAVAIPVWWLWRRYFLSRARAHDESFDDPETRGVAEASVAK